MASIPRASARLKRSAGQRESQDASRPGWHRTRRIRDRAGSSGVGTCKGRPFGAAYGGACRPDLDRTRPLRFSALTSAGKSLPKIGQPRFLKGSPDMRAPSTLRTRPHTTPPAPANTMLRRGRARRAAAELTPHAVEQIAQRVAQLLHEHHDTDARPAPAPAQLLDATQLARHLGVTRTWVYEHAQQLGAIRLGTGSKARLRFDLDTATAAIKNLHEPTPGSAAPASKTPRRGRPRRRYQPAVPLLPIHEPRARGIRARIARIGRGR